MTKKIFSSIFAAAVIVFFISIALIMGVLYNYFSDVQMQQLHIQAELAARGVELKGEDYLNRLDDNDCRVTWIDQEGNVLFDNKASSGGMENHLQRREIIDALRSGTGEDKRYSATLMERQLYAAVRLTDGTVLRLSGSQYTWWSLLLEMLQPILLTGAAAAGISLFLAFQLSKWIVHPLNTLNLDKPEAPAEYEEIIPLLERIESQQRRLQRQEAELKQRRAELEEAEQIRREFTANVSHELKTPLQSISGYAEILSAGMVKNADVPQFSEQIYFESKRLTALVEDLIHLSHLDEGTGDMHRMETDLYKLAEETLRRLAPAAEAAGISLSLDGSTAVVDGIPALLGGILYNLCDNAVKYNQPGGKVEVCIKPGDKEVLLSVLDTGIGIEESEQGRIFERFYRVDKSHSKKAGGTGLGLSIVKHSARLHNADIRIDSAPGKGTRIEVSFPKSAF